MLDLTDPETWRRQFDEFLAASIPSAVFLVIGAVASWWLRGWFSQREVSGLREHSGVLEERWKLAREQAEQSRAETEKLKIEVENFRTRMQGRMIISPKELEESATSVLTSVARLIKREHDLGETLDSVIPIVRATGGGASSHAQ